MGGVFDLTERVKPVFPRGHCRRGISRYVVKGTLITY